MMWEHRIVDMSHENGGDPWVEIREVHYDKGKILGHTSICTGSEDADGLIFCLERMLTDVRNTKVINGITLEEIQNEPNT